MPLTLPPSLILEKNKIAAEHPWVILLDVVFPNEAAIYITSNNEDVIFDGQSYTSFPFDIDMVDQSTKGDIPTLGISFSNVTRYFQYYLEETAGAVGASVKITVVNTDNLAADYSELEMNYTVLSATADAKQVKFVLGVPNPLRRQYPIFRYIARHCSWARYYKGVECKYAGAETTCDGNYETCKSRGNQARFGGYMGLQNIGLKVV